MSLMSVKSVPGCFVTMAPSLIGVSVAFWPLPSPHFDAFAAASFEAASLPLLPLLPLLSSLSPHATRPTDITATHSVASMRGRPHSVVLRTESSSWE